MAKAVQAAPSTVQIMFELNRFELDGDRLELSGRWFGVRGRRFVRPTLTPLGGRQLSRVLADLEHKPWPAEDGEPWVAAFPWDQNGAAVKFELSVAPDITIELPAPSGRLGRPRRLAALPRRPSPADAWRPLARMQPEERQPEPEETAEASPRIDPELESAQAELERAKHELESASAELEVLRRQLADRATELEATRAELGAVTASRDAASDDATNAVGELAEAQRTVRELRSELEEARHAVDQAARERDAAVSQLDGMAHQRDELARERDAAVRQRDEAAAAHGAALVMRRATRTPSNYNPPSSWPRTALAILVLIAVIFAILIVAHVL